MKLNILNSVNNETFTANAIVTEVSNVKVYSIMFEDDRMAKRFGTIEISKDTDFWRVPSNKDRDIISISFKLIDAIMEIEFESE